ncbi:MFS transporter [Kitasatospora sp. NPDC089509]|uniref:MFS transporter n=1 Tax=Kitasatospora sp. NPDC089509 TaxID=3364079 RepID=UPI003816B198
MSGGSVSGRTVGASRWRGVLGIPEISARGHRWLVVAVFVDTLGVGMVVPLSFLYFTLSTNLSLAGVGAALSAAILLSLPTGFVAGTLVDRYGSKPLLIINNVVAAVGYLLYVFATDWFGVFSSMFVVMVADRMYWAAWPAFVKRATGAADMDAWFALTEAVKNGCFGIGALLGAAALAIDGKAGATVLIVLNAISSLVAAWLFALIKVDAPRTNTPAAPSGATTTAMASATERPVRPWVHVLRQRWMLPLVLAQSALTFAWLLPVSILPVYAVNVLHLGAWLPSTLFALNCVGVFFLQPLVTARLRPVRRTRAVMVSGLLAIVAIVVLAAVPKASGDGTALLPSVLVVAASLLVTTASMFYLPSSNALISSAAEAEFEGRTVSLFQMAWAFSAGVGPALIGGLLDTNPQCLWLLLGALTLAGSLGFLLAERLLPRHSLLASAPATATT